MPRSVNTLPEESKCLVTEDRKWRQEKLYKQMTDRCIDEVAMPLRRLQLLPEELVTLKIIMLFNYGNHAQQGKFIFLNVIKLLFRRCNNVHY